MPQAIIPAVIAGAGAAASGAISGTFVIGSMAMLTSVGMAAGGSLLMSGASMLLASGSGKSKAVTASRASSTVNARQAIVAHSMLYGVRRIGGAIVFDGSSGDNLYLHRVITLACHEIESIDEVWLGDECIPADYIDANGNVTAGKYENTVRIIKHTGSPSQSADTYLVSECTEWTTAHKLSGRAYIYVRLKYSQDTFASGIPVITAVVKGKRVLDPRDGNIKFTTNPALIARDYLSDIAYGFEATSNIDDESVIAAANNCDEIVTVQDAAYTALEVLASQPDTIELDCDTLPLALGDRVTVTSSGTMPGGVSSSLYYYVIPYQSGRQTGNWANNKPRIRLATSYADALAGISIDITSAGSGTITVTKNGEPRYSCAAYVDTSRPIGDNMIEILSSFGGRLVYAGGNWRMIPTAWTVPVMDIGIDDIVAPINVTTKISRSERFNAIKGVYRSHMDLWQEADYPSIQDDAAISRDGFKIIRDYDLPCTYRPYTAQRLAKVELKKAAQEITATIVCNLRALAVQCGDNITVTNERFGWSAKPFEVTEFKFVMGGNGDEPELSIQLTLRETSEYIYDWASSEESAIDTAPNTSLPNVFVVSAVSGLSFDSVPAETRDGDEVYNIRVNWIQHPDAFVREGGRYEVQYKRNTATEYQPSFFVDGELIQSTIAVGSVGISYDIRVRAVNNIGARSNWQYLTGAVSGGSGGSVTTEDWGGVADDVTTSEDWGGVADDVTTSEDWGAV